jgi:hypothetical protein
MKQVRASGLVKRRLAASFEAIVPVHFCLCDMQPEMSDSARVSSRCKQQGGYEPTLQCPAEGSNLSPHPHHVSVQTTRAACEKKDLGGQRPKSGGAARLLPLSRGREMGSAGEREALSPWLGRSEVRPRWLISGCAVNRGSHLAVH